MKSDSDQYRHIFENAATGIYHTLFENSNDAIVIYRFNEILKYNRRAVELFGFPEKDQFYPLINIFPEYQPDGAKSIQKAQLLIKRVLNGESMIFDWVHKKFNGEEFFTEVSLNRLDIGIEGCFQAIIRDISEYVKQKQNEERFHKIFDNAPVGIARTIPGDRLLLANQKLAEIFDFPDPESMLSEVKSLANDLYKSQELRTSVINEIIQSGRHQGTYEVYTRTGKKRIINLNAIASYNKSGNIEWIDSIIEDITERKIAEEELRKSEERYRLLMENMNEVVMLVDNNDKVLYVNKKFTETLGYEPGEIVGKTGYEVLLDADERNVIIEANKKRTQNITSQYEICFKAKDGHRIDFLVSGAPIFEQGKVVGSIGTMTDITLRKNVEQALRESEELFRKVVDLTPYSIVVTDMEGRFLLVNKSFIESTALNPNEIAGKTASDIGYKIIPVKGESILQELQTKGSVHNLEAEVTDNNGNVLYVLLSCRIIHMHNAPAILTSTVDITEKRKIQLELEKHKNHLEILVKSRTEEIEVLNEELIATNEELYQNNEELNSLNEALANQKKQLEETIERLKLTQMQLVQSEKMASVGILTAGIAHEINNPINFISSGITGLELIINDLLHTSREYTDHYINDENCRCKELLSQIGKRYNAREAVENITKLLQSIHIGVERTTNIVKSLRTFSRLDSETKSHANIHDLIDSSLTILNNKIKDRIKVEKKYNLSDLVNCYPGKMSQVFMNLLINAIQAMEKGGTITIVTQKVQPDSIELIFRDTGKGMSKEIQSKIFDPFFTTKPVGEGTGMGLSIVHGIIRDHNGDIFVSSRPQKGTEFKIVLPAN